MLFSKKYISLEVLMSRVISAELTMYSCKEK